MRKSDKKIDNALRKALTEVCDSALDHVMGFVWLTHLVDYNAFPKSLRVVCVFERDEDLRNAMSAKLDSYLYQRIDEELKRIDITLTKIQQQVSFDTEEACQRSHGGKWAERLSARSHKGVLH